MHTSLHSSLDTTPADIRVSYEVNGNEMTRGPNRCLTVDQAHPIEVRRSVLRSSCPNATPCFVQFILRDAVEH
jgi:hypothetical protein